jgi:hypothetical protein
MSKEDREKIKLTVTGQRVLTTWNDKRNRETHLWEVEAVDEHGQQYRPGKLRSFAELEEGRLIEYEVEPYDHPQHGRSWTVHRPKANTTQRVVELERQVSELFDLVRGLEQKMEDQAKPLPEIRQGGRAGFHGGG